MPAWAPRTEAWTTRMRAPQQRPMGGQIRGTTLPMEEMPYSMPTGGSRPGQPAQTAAGPHTQSPPAGEYTQAGIVPGQSQSTLGSTQGSVGFWQ